MNDGGALSGSPARARFMTDDFEIGIDVNPRAEALARVGMDEETCVTLAAQAIQAFLDDHGAPDQDLADLTIAYAGSTYRLGDLADVVIG
jgi:hypothetical protein